MIIAETEIDVPNYDVPTQRVLNAFVVSMRETCGLVDYNLEDLIVRHARYVRVLCVDAETLVIDAYDDVDDERSKFLITAIVLRDQPSPAVLGAWWVSNERNTPVCFVQPRA